MVHAYTDHYAEDNVAGQGHFTEVNDKLRTLPATWRSGVAPSLTITPNGGSADNVNLATSAGVVYQLHDHVFPAFDTGVSDYIKVVNDSGTAYVKTTDLAAQLTDSTGASMANSYFSLVVIGVQSETSGESDLLLNVPAGSYNTSALAITDPDRLDNYSVPAAYTGTAIMIARITLRHQAAASGTWTEIQTEDLRGQNPSVFVGGHAATTNEFVDSNFKLLDNGDATKIIQFDAASIATGNTRTLTMSDHDLPLAADSTTGGDTVPLSVTANGFGLDISTIDGSGVLASGSGNLNMSITTLSPAAVDVATDSIAFEDDSDGLNGTRVELISDMVALQAGNGIAATAGVFSVSIPLEVNTAGVGSPNILTASESPSIMTNEGAGALNYHTLPTAAAGLTFTFIVQDANGIRITANTGDTIRVAGTVSIAAGYTDSTTVGSTITLVAINITEWIVTSLTGAWDIETS